METQRHPIRFLFRLLVLVGLVALVAKFFAEQKKEWYGLTESEARAKFETKLADKVGQDQANAIADQVITALVERGVLKPDPEDMTQEASAEESVDLTAVEEAEEPVDA